MVAVNSYNSYNSQGGWGAVRRQRFNPEEVGPAPGSFRMCEGI